MIRFDISSFRSVGQPFICHTIRERTYPHTQVCTTTSDQQCPKPTKTISNPSIVNGLNRICQSRFTTHEIYNGVCMDKRIQYEQKIHMYIRCVGTFTAKPRTITHGINAMFYASLNKCPTKPVSHTHENITHVRNERANSLPQRPNTAHQSPGHATSSSPAHIRHVCHVHTTFVTAVRSAWGCRNGSLR